MGWTWVNDLLAPEGRKKDGYMQFRCPYHLCPSNQPLGVEHPPRMKFMQRLSPMVYQYKCKDCGCLINKGIEVPDARGGMQGLNPLLWGGKKAIKHVQNYQ